MKLFEHRSEAIPLIGHREPYLRHCLANIVAALGEVEEHCGPSAHSVE